MSKTKFQIAFFISLAVGVLVLNTFIFFPYLSVLFVALVLAVVFEPMHEYFAASLKGRRTLSSLVSVLIILFFVLMPLAGLALVLVAESADIYGFLANRNITVDGITSFLSSLLPEGVALPSIDLAAYGGAISGWVVRSFSGILSGFASLLLGTLLVVLALFYFFRDGKRFLAGLVELSPLGSQHNATIVESIKRAVSSVVRGNLVVAMIQGIMSGVGYLIFGVPSPVLLGFFAALSALIPFIGTSVVSGLAALYLLLSGSPAAALGLVLWSVIAVGLVDNLVAPILINRGVKIHPFLILLSVLGGLSLYGPVGFIAGPVSLALLFAMKDIYKEFASSNGNK